MCNLPLGGPNAEETIMALPTPYTMTADDIDKMNATELNGLRIKYLAYFHENQLQIANDVEAWAMVGDYLIQRAIDGNTNDQSIGDFIDAIQASGPVPGGILKPEFAKTVQYVQSDKNAGIWRLALPDKEFAEQARLHTHNKEAKVEGTYTLAPIFKGFIADLKSDKALRCRICDYVLSHCA
jgi:hypothetical protein